MHLFVEESKDLEEVKLPLIRALSPDIGLVLDVNDEIGEQMLFDVTLLWNALPDFSVQIFCSALPTRLAFLRGLLSFRLLPVPYRDPLYELEFNVPLDLL